MDNLTDDQKKKMATVLYYMSKSADRDSFVDFLDFCGLTTDEWEPIKKHIEQTLGVELYV